MGIIFLGAKAVECFVPAPRINRSLPFMATSLPDIEAMRVPEMRKELESYGISTKSFFEKKEMIDALKNARAEGKKPIEQGDEKEKDENTSEELSREERIKLETEKAKKMKVGDLKKELQDRGISTKSFFEKTDFVKAYAEAVVDGIQNPSKAQEEKYDASYRDVAMQKFDKRDPRLTQGSIIDVKLAE